MSRILYLDCPTGIAGDMLLAALMDAGADQEYLQQQLAKLPLSNWQMKFQEVQRCGIRGLHLDFCCQPEHHHRNFSLIKDMINSTDWPEPVKKNAENIFTVLASAEAAVHNCPIDQVHFHEVGAADSILDICGAALALHQLAITDIYFSPLPLSSGQVRCAHGMIPLPAPAGAFLMEGMKLQPTQIIGETVTPTGAAILRGMKAQQICPAFTLEQMGMGAGTADFPHIPNILRAFIGNSDTDNDLLTDHVEVLRTNIDDADGELLGQLWQQAFNSGALDMSYSPLIMKKSRPAWALEMIVPEGTGEKFARLIFAHTTAIGLRIDTVRRLKLAREIIAVETQYGRIDMKISGNTASPEADQITAAAAKHQVPFKVVYNAALAAYHKTISQQNRMEK